MTTAHSGLITAHSGLITAHNLLNDTTMSFDANTTPLWAVCYAYCEENNLMSALFASAQENRFEEFSRTLPITTGAKTLACGNWAALLPSAQPTVHDLGIDVATSDAKRLIRRLKRLKSTLTVDNGGMYHADKSYSQVHITTTMTEAELDDWLYRTKHGAEYFGTFTRD